jgi:hypothetical protein
MYYDPHRQAIVPFSDLEIVYKAFMHVYGGQAHHSYSL